jgi:cytochrome c oxidase assembly protein subunit 11
MSVLRSRHFPVLLLVGAMLAVMTGLVVYAPSLYRAFCNLTGYGGTVKRIAEADIAKSAAAGPTITVHFDANVAPGLAWDFHPEQSKVETHLGEPTLIYYDAKNNSSETVIARATFNVTPYKAAPYFFKIQCFCFTDEKLAPGQSARMPVELYVDEQLLKDPGTREVRDITLSYTFFQQNDLPADKIVGARDLKAGSAALDSSLKNERKVGFDNDAPRR